MGRISKNTSITVKDAAVGGPLFGDGNASEEGGNIAVSIYGSSFIHNNVYGGGNQASVSGDNKVTIGECE